MDNRFYFGKQWYEKITSDAPEITYADVARLTDYRPRLTPIAFYVKAAFATWPRRG